MAFEREYRELSFVPRWTNQRVLREQRVDAHSYYVALYAMQIAHAIEWDLKHRKNGGSKMGDLAHAALVHDLVEGTMGDWPGPVKRALVDPQKRADWERNTVLSKFGAWGEAPNLGHGIREILRCADRLDEMFHLCVEHEMGNKAVGRPLVGLMGIDPNWDRNGEARTVFEDVGRRLSRSWLALVPFAGVDRDKLMLIWKDQVLHQIYRAVQDTSRIFCGDTGV